MMNEHTTTLEAEGWLEPEEWGEILPWIQKNPDFPAVIAILVGHLVFNGVPTPHQIGPNTPGWIMNFEAGADEPYGYLQFDSAGELVAAQVFGKDVTLDQFISRIRGS